MGIRKKAIINKCTMCACKLFHKEPYGPFICYTCKRELNPIPIEEKRIGWAIRRKYESQYLDVELEKYRNCTIFKFRVWHKHVDYERFMQEFFKLLPEDNDLPLLAAGGWFGHITLDTNKKTMEAINGY